MLILAIESSCDETAVAVSRNGREILSSEVLSQIDDKRAAALLNMLSKYCADGAQCLLFSCHTRESGMVEANVIKL